MLTGQNIQLTTLSLGEAARGLVPHLSANGLEPMTKMVNAWWNTENYLLNPPYIPRTACIPIFACVICMDSVQFRANTYHLEIKII